MDTISYLYLENFSANSEKYSIIFTIAVNATETSPSPLALIFFIIFLPSYSPAQ